MASLLNKPLLLVNADAALLMSNKALLPVADRIAFGFDGPATKKIRCAVVTGNPVRAEIESLPPPAERYAGRSGPLRLLVVGGSLGAKALNDCLPAALALLRRHRGGVYVNTTVLPSWVLLGRLARRRVVCHVHEAEWPGPAALHRVLLSGLLAADVVVANSRFTHRVLTGLLPALAGRTLVVPNAVTAPAEPEPARARYDRGCPPPPPTGGTARDPQPSRGRRRPRRG
jgi:hypothetical protein